MVFFRRQSDKKKPNEDASTPNLPQHSDSFAVTSPDGLGSSSIIIRPDQRRPSPHGISQSTQTLMGPRAASERVSLSNESDDPSCDSPAFNNHDDESTNSAPVMVNEPLPRLSPQLSGQATTASLQIPKSGDAANEKHWKVEKKGHR
eukprot:Ihof_evm5s210 gene=Ihof_evmTU5s210